MKQFQYIIEWAADIPFTAFALLYFKPSKICDDFISAYLNFIRINI